MGKRVYLSRDAILEADDLKTEDVNVVEWGGTVRVRTLTGSERDELEAAVTRVRGTNTEVNLDNFRAKIVAMSVVDEDGKRLFKMDDVKALGQKSGTALNRVFAVAQRLSGLNPADVEELTANLS